MRKIYCIIQTHIIHELKKIFLVHPFIIIININKTHIFQVTKKTLIFIQVIISDIFIIVIMLVDIWAQKN